MPDAEAQRAVQAAWAEARALASLGGALDQLAPVIERLREIDRLRALAARTTSVDGARRSLALQYADAAVRAAIAAAQDERDDMKVFLSHARGLDRQLAGLGAPASSPLPIDELEGELWLEVDRFVEARDAYLRAVALHNGAGAWLGLARATDRLGDRLAACDAYRRSMLGPLNDADKEESLAYLNSDNCRQTTNLKVCRHRRIGNTSWRQTFRFVVATPHRKHLVATNL
jgi:tetratricopeptide (TPR) repeat protein